VKESASGAYQEQAWDAQAGSGFYRLSLTATRGGGVVGGIQYISDENRKITGVIVPIDLWREIQAEQETAYLLKTEAMKTRLLKARKRKGGIPIDQACKELGI